MKKLLALLTFLLVSFSVHAQNYDQAIHEADSIVQYYFDGRDLPGMSISVYKGDHLIWSKGYGYADIQNQVPVNPSLTKFRIGSVSKTLTSAGLGLLIQDGRIDPDAVVQTYVPDFPEKEYPITVRQVAGHIAGIRHYIGFEFMSNKLYPTIDEGLDIFKNDALLFEPGTQYSYSSYGWNLISAVMEGASGEDFLPFMKEHVFDPLGMNNTVPEWSNQEIPNLTKFYIPNNNGGNDEAPFVDNSYKWAGGGFVGTTEDLIRFGVGLMDYDYLNEQTQLELMTPLETSDGETTNYGMGWRLLNYNNRYWIGHSGGSVGGSTMFIMSKQERMVIAFTINRSNAGFDNLHFRVAEVFLKK